ncbi:monoglyceride lipase-like isoform X2 [Babylonia areolata]|uniref:monoglyceride lipase-like isoform X2 n=1 Tax=Babylonia areolata TaxID=304850 RepID=UPI003FD2260C
MIMWVTARVKGTESTWKTSMSMCVTPSITLTWWLSASLTSPSLSLDTPCASLHCGTCCPQGGAISIVAAMERPDYFAGMVLIAPAVMADPNSVTPLRVFLGRIAARICPQITVLKLDTSNMSRDPAVVSRYLADPLVYQGGLKARWGKSMLEWMQWVESNITTLKCPFLTLHGTADKATLSEGSVFLDQNASSSDKTCKLYEGYYHQLHNEPGEDGIGVQREIVDWIASRLKP